MSDTQPVSTPRGQTYGVAEAQEQAQQVVPMAGQPAPPTPGAGRTGGGAGSRRTGGGGVGGAGAGGAATSAQAPTQLPGMGPGEVPTIEDPSIQPNTPVQDGLPTGPGSGPETLQTAQLDRDLTTLQQVYKLYPSEALANLIDFHREKITAAETPQPTRNIVPRPPIPQVQEATDPGIPENLMAENVGADGTPLPVDTEAQMEFEDAGTGVPTDAPAAQPATQPATQPTSAQSDQS